MATQAQILSDMLTALGLSVPDLDTSIGSLTRHMYDPVAEALAERDSDAYLHTYAYDIDAKRGADLDEMVRLFGFSRLPAQRASGEVVFMKTAPSATIVAIPQGTQVATTGGIVTQTAVPAVLPAGDTSVSVPATALEGGARGNVPAASLTVRKTALEGITSTTNLVAFTGGTDAESDAHLRKRFKDTIFRSLAGTEQMFLGVALNDPDVTQANVVGATRRFYERVEVISGEAASTVQDAAFIIPDSSVVGRNIQGGSIFTANVHYTFDDSVNPPTITSLDATAMPDGIYDLEFEYVPSASRNDLENGISNRVDIYVKGSRPTAASETLIFKTARKMNNTTSSPYYRQNYRRKDESVPVDGNFFVPYALVPVIDPSNGDTITINSVTYAEGVHYWLVYNVTAYGQAPRSLAGIEIRSSANGSALADPPDDSRFPVAYTYNAVPRSIEEAIGGTWRLVNQDVWVHEGKKQRLRLHFAIIIQRGYSEAQILTNLTAALSAHIDSIGFRNVLQASDLLSVAHNVSGVDAVRFLTDVDNPTHYAIERVTESGTFIARYASSVSPKRALDVYCGDDETPVLDLVVLDVMAQNSWGSV